jgi:ABC-2 type transport system ATP-binding protein
MTKYVIQVSDFRKKYGSLLAVDNISFNVEEGEIFGIVGPNGAGKTTTVECLEGLRERTSGNISILGLDPIKDAKKLKNKMGIQLQESMLPDRMKAWEALDLFASLFDHSIPWKPLVAELGLEDKMNAYFDNLSGGQKQRLSIAMSLVNDPEIVFFDELTSGLDPQARRTIWEMVENVRDKGKTVILVTHFMEEAERLCDRIAIIDHGKLIALDSPRNLIKNLKKHYTVKFTSSSKGLDEVLLNNKSITNCICKGDHYTMDVTQIKTVADIINLLSDREIEFDDFAILQPNLEDVFIELTGRKIRD